jgi:hypothetical protein
MKHLTIILTLLVSLKVYCQTSEEDNWRITTTKISIDKNCILKDTLIIEGTKFNYFKFYPKQKFTEYGNITNDFKPNGKWLYINNKGAIFLKGESKNGYKIDKWEITVGSKKQFKKQYVYQWTTDNSKTVWVYKPTKKHKKGSTTVSNKQKPIYAK